MWPFTRRRSPITSEYQPVIDPELMRVQHTNGRRSWPSCDDPIADVVCCSLYADPGSWELRGDYFAGYAFLDHARVDVAVRMTDHSQLMLGGAGDYHHVGRADAKRLTIAIAHWLRFHMKPAEAAT